MLGGDQCCCVGSGCSVGRDGLCPPAQARAEGGRGVLGLALGSAGVKRAPRGAGIISAQG